MMIRSDVESLEQLGAGARSAFVSCVRAATRAPSIHNSQPWLFGIHNDRVDVFADPTRRLDIVDPSGRELLISVGASLFNLRLAMRARGRLPVVRLFPDDSAADLVATVVAGAAAAPDAATAALAAAIPVRHTSRRPFAPVAVPAALIGHLAEATAAEGAALRIADRAGRVAILRLASAAAHRLAARGIHKADISPRRSMLDTTASGWRAMEALPLRDFGFGVPAVRGQIDPLESYPAIAVLATHGDDRRQWVVAGQALQRLLLTATLSGLGATPMTQPLEIPELRAQVSDPAAGMWAQVILRLGYGPPAPPSSRRPLESVLLPDEP